MSVTFRKGKAGDWKIVYDLICDMEGTELPAEAFRGIYEEKMHDPRFYCLLAKENGEVLGVLNLRFEKQLHHAAAVAEIMEFSVSPACRGRGVGEAVFREACRLAREAGCVQIEVACNQLRERTHRFYLGRGGMHNFHYRFSKPLTGEDSPVNRLGR